MSDIYDKQDNLPYTIFCEIFMIDTGDECFTIQVFEDLVVRTPPQWDHLKGRKFTQINEFKHFQIARIL